MSRAPAEPATVPARELAWWRRPRGVAVTPVGGLALAAGFAGLVLGVQAAVGRALGRAPSAQVMATAPAARGGRPAAVAGGGARDTVHLVRFVLVGPAAEKVALVGDFNGWDREATRLVRTGASRTPGTSVWTVTVPLEAGRHEYAFVLDGERWMADPAAPSVEDEFGTRSSVLTLARDAADTGGGAAHRGAQSL